MAPPDRAPLDPDLDRTVTVRAGFSTQTPPSVLAGRYELGRFLGAGGGGQVYEARDRHEDRAVAVKFLHSLTDSDLRRVRREVGALRQLDMPGVVRFLDEGQETGWRYLVMELVEGQPFPGECQGSWDHLQGPTLALLETLARMHATGVVHRDHKPSNILVNAGGIPTILDFGLTWGPTLGSRITSSGKVVGTPHYLAPEQVSGRHPDARTDLYSVGVMIYESLAGHRPHGGSDVQDLFTAKLVQRPAPLRDVAPGAPRHVAAAVDRLLEVDPKLRFSHAADAIAALRGGSDRRSGLTLPRLGGPAVVDSLIMFVEAGASVDLLGGPGLGRTRCLEDLAEALANRDIPCQWLPNGRQPFETVAPLLDDLLSSFEGADLESLTRMVESIVGEALDSGMVLLVDDHEGIDRWSREVLDRLRWDGRIVRAFRHEDDTAVPCVGLEPLTREDLEVLFAGPDRLFHLREDAAAELHRRTDGVPALVVEELEAWLRWNLASRDGDLITIDRANLERLRVGLALSPLAFRVASPRADLDDDLDDLLAWIQLGQSHATTDLLLTALGRPRWQVEAAVHDLLGRGVVRCLPDGRLEALAPARSLQSWSGDRLAAAHSAIAAGLAPGTPGRLVHVLACGEVEDVVEETRCFAAAQTDLGQLGRAEAAIREGLIFVRERAEEESAALPLFEEWTKIAFSLTTTEALSRVRAEIRAPAPPLAALQRLVDAGIDVRSGRTDLALEKVRTLAPFEDEKIELWRHAIRWQAARAISVDREAEELAAIGHEVSASGPQGAPSSIDAWMGLLRYRQGLFDEAAELQVRASETHSRISPRIAALTNAAASYLEIARFTNAGRYATDALRLATQSRHPYHEARASWVLRAIAYRTNETKEPDLELISACELLRNPALEAQVLLNEAAVAWRINDSKTARDLALRAQARWKELGRKWNAHLSWSLALVVGETAVTETIRGVIDEVPGCNRPGIGLQVLGLLRRVVSGNARQDGEMLEAARQLAGRIPRELWEYRREIISVTEALAEA